MPWEIGGTFSASPASDRAVGPVGGAIGIGPEADLGAGVGPIGAGTTGRGMALGGGGAALGIVGVRNAEGGAPIGARAVGGVAAGAAPGL